MKDVRSTVMQLSGRWGNTCYNMLCLAVEAARGLPREEFQMKRIWSAVREATGKSPETISRALTRAATDIWERGNRELLMAIFARTLTKAPTAKALVYTLAEYVKPSLDYRCFSEPRSGQYGLLVRLDCEPVAMTAPFSANRADVEKLAAQLTVQQRRRDSRGSARADRRMDKTGRRDVGGVPYGFLKIIRLCVGAD